MKYKGRFTLPELTRLDRVLYASRDSYAFYRAPGDKKRCYAIGSCCHKPVLAGSVKALVKRLKRR